MSGRTGKRFVVCAVLVCMVIIACCVAIGCASQTIPENNAVDSTNTPASDNVSDNRQGETEGEDRTADTDSGLAERTAEIEQEIGAPDEDYVADEVVVSLNEGISPEDAIAAAQAAGFEIVEDGATGASDPSLAYLVLSVPQGSSVAQAMAIIESDDSIGTPQPNYLYSLMSDEFVTQAVSPNDALLSNQWYLDAADVRNAWKSAQCNGNVTVAVLDTGIMADHEDLKDRIVGGYNAVVEENPNDITPAASEYHGTHVAGIIAAQANNGIGTAGVSYNADILPVRIFDSSGKGCTTAVIARGLRYLLSDADGQPGGQTIAQKYNVRVVNMSIGMEWKSDTDVPPDRLARNAIDDITDAGIITVCASGNAGSGFPKIPTLAFPADYDKCVSVVALDEYDKRTSTSNYGSEKDISAPGMQMLSTYGPSASSYEYSSGTSMAAPVVAGVAALCVAANEDISVDQIKEALYTSAVDLGVSGKDSQFGWGMVDAAAAVTVARQVSIAGPDSVTVDTDAEYSIVNSTANDWVYSVKGEGATITTDGTLSVSVVADDVVITATSATDAASPVTRTVSAAPRVVDSVDSVQQFAYSGQTITAISADDDYIVTGDSSAVGPGSYIGYTSLVDPTKTVWSNRSTADIKVEWDIVSFWPLFHDVSDQVNDYGFDGVWYVHDGWLDSVFARGVMAGYTDGSQNFGPYDDVSRGQAACVIYRALTGHTADSSDNSVATGFSDAPADEYYSAAVAWCASNGIITGYTDGPNSGLFVPDVAVTREELSVMMARAIGWAQTGKADVLPASPDRFNALFGTEDVSKWAEDSIIYCCDAGLVQGIDGVYLSPGKTAWRASMAKMVTVAMRDVLGRW